MTFKPLFTAHATATGGRNGHSEASDKSVVAELSTPKEMGGTGKPGTTTPEHLFATGYAACFSSALDFVARQQKHDVTGASITADVTIGTRDAGGFGLQVALHAHVPGQAQADAEKLVSAAHAVCPYSNAISGNVPVTLVVTV
jgi:lipoyl-dependent peroxiredoxin